MTDFINQLKNAENDKRQEELETKAKKQKQNELVKDRARRIATSITDEIKNVLYNKAKNGEYILVNGKKTVSAQYIIGTVVGHLHNHIYLGEYLGNSYSVESFERENKAYNFYEGDGDGGYDFYRAFYLIEDKTTCKDVLWWDTTTHTIVFKPVEETYYLPSEISRLLEENGIIYNNCRIETSIDGYRRGEENKSFNVMKTQIKPFYEGKIEEFSYFVEGSYLEIYRIESSVIIDVSCSF